MREGLDNMDAINLFFFNAYTCSHNPYLQLHWAVPVSYSATSLGRARFIYRMDPLETVSFRKVA